MQIVVEDSTAVEKLGWSRTALKGLSKSLKVTGLGYCVTAPVVWLPVRGFLLILIFNL